jgi:DNA-binding transcriptional LysR family regulator
MRATQPGPEEGAALVAVLDAAEAEEARRMMPAFRTSASPRMDRITAMSAFVRVVEAGNFSKAADSLDVPRPTVTRLIQGLESELGVRLLQRTTRSVTVTPEGAAYYERVVRLLAELADIESAAKQSLARPSGRIRVETAVAIGTRVIVPALPRFYAAHPGVEIELGVGNRVADLVAEGIDCAVRPGEITEQSLVARRIGQFRFVACAAPGYLEARGAPASPDDLRAAHEVVGLMPPDGARVLPFQFLKDGQQVDVAPTPRLQITDTNAYLAAGLAGLGVIQAPSFAVRSLIDDGRLVEVLAGWRTPVVPVHVVYPPNRFLTAKVRVFIDWLVELFEQDRCLRLP